MSCSFFKNEFSYKSYPYDNSVVIYRGETMAVVFSNGLMMSTSTGENFDGLVLRTMRELEDQVGCGRGREMKLWFAPLVLGGVLIIVNILN